MEQYAYFIHATTGCSCCSASEDHYRGPYRSRSDAERRVAYYLSKDSKFWPTASQYYNRGLYYIIESTHESISGDRVIIGNSHVFSTAEAAFIDVREDGTIENDKQEYFGGDDLNL